MSDNEFDFWTTLDWGKLSLREFNKLSKGFSAYKKRFEEEIKALKSISFHAGMTITHNGLYDWLIDQGFKPSCDQFGEEVGVLVDAVWLLIMVETSEVAIPGYAEWVYRIDTRLKWVVVSDER